MQDFRKISENDNVAVALRELLPSVQVIVDGGAIRINDRIEFGHKFAIKEISKGSGVVKYGEIIGEATSDIKPGDHVHINNLISLRVRRAH